MQLDDEGNVFPETKVPMFKTTLLRGYKVRVIFTS